jgi:SAM-dependent methyltransferase
MMWDERYSEEGYIYGTEPNDFLAENYQRIPKGKVLCLADGEGRNSVFLAEQGYTVTAVDASSVGIEKGKRLAADRGVQVESIHADLAEFTIEPGCWQGVVSIFAHVPPPVRQRIHRQVVESLLPGGVLLLEAYTPKQLELGTGGPPVPELTMDLQRLEAELPGLNFELAQEMERDVVEGKYHTGRGAVVQLIAVKPK